MGTREVLHPARLFFAAVLILIAAVTHAATRDDDDLVDEPAANNPEQNEPMVVFRNVEQNIDSWVYGTSRNGRGGPEQLRFLLKTKVVQVARSAHLTEGQKEKLRLAGEGDIRHFVERIDEMKLKFQGPEMRAGAWNIIFREIRPLQMEVRKGLFGENSLFDKTLAENLTPEQRDRYDQTERGRLAFQHRARVQMTVVRLGNQLGLRRAQRKKLVALLLEKTRPTPPFGQQDQFVVVAQMSRLPEETLKPLFDDGQWRQLQVLFRRVEQMLPMLRQMGFDLDRDGAAVEFEKVHGRPSAGGGPVNGKRFQKDVIR